MAFNKQQAIEAAKNIMNGPRLLEMPRLDFIAHAVTPRRRYERRWDQPGIAETSYDAPTVEMPVNAPAVMRNLAWKSRTNFLPLILDTFAQVMKVDGYVEANGKTSSAWDRWQLNGLDARQTGIHRSALQYGATYATILPGTKGAAIEAKSPRRMTAIYEDAANDDWPMMALEVNGPKITLYDETHKYDLGLEHYRTSGLGQPASLVLPPGVDWSFIDSNPHGMDFCPVARFRDRMLLAGEEAMGIVEPLIDIQSRIDEGSFGLITAQYFTAFTQRYIIGWYPETDAEKMKAEVSSFWAFKDKDVKVGQFQAGDLSKYIESKNSALADLSAIAQVPASALGSGGAAMRNVSPEAVASNDAGQDRKSGEIRTSFGETWELVLRTAAAIDGDTDAAADSSAQVRWKDMSTTSPGAIVDALGKMQQMLGIPAELLWKRLPGWTDQDQDEAVNLIKSGDSLDKMMITLGKQMPGADVPPGPGQAQPQDPAVAAGPMGNGG